MISKYTQNINKKLEKYRFTQYQTYIHKHFAIFKKTRKQLKNMFISIGIFGFIVIIYIIIRGYYEL